MIRSVSLLIIIIILGCSSIESPEKLWEQVKLFRSEKNLKDAIATCKLILKEHPKNEFASTALFQVGDIYLNDVQDFDFAIQYFQEVVDKYPESKETEKALFMIGYIFANNLDSYSDAEEYYQKFISTFPQSELIQSVQYELKMLKPLLNTIDSLNAIVEKE
jgi:TolA-binding protein